ncbi:MAG: hypothetical protein AAFP99_10220 [Pseudomonadota bacterium]
MAKLFALAGLALCASATFALAQEGRFVMERTENGIIRMDTQTGDMAMCQEDENQIICRAAADERAAFQQQLDALEERIIALETQIGVVGSGDMARDGGLPSEEEFERGLDYMERFFERFRGFIEEDRSDGTGGRT